MLKRTTEVVKHREGGDNSTDRKSPGRTTYEAITLERGVTHDPEFERWANLVHPLEDAAMDLKNFRKDLVLLLNNERGLTVKRYKLFRCWVSEYQAVPDLDANANAVAIEHMKLSSSRAGSATKARLSPTRARRCRRRADAHERCAVMDASNRGLARPVPPRPFGSAAGTLESTRQRRSPGAR